VNRNIFITTHGLKISKHGNYLMVKGKDLNEKIPVGAFDNVFVLANVNFTAQVLKFLSKNGKWVFIINTSGKLQSIVAPQLLTSATSNREKQYRKFENKSLRIFLVKELLFYKANLSYKAIEKFRKAQGLHPLNYSFYKDFLKDVNSMIERSDSIEVLRGVDGFIMRTIYTEFATSIKNYFQFKTRSYHPPKDEANAVLSFVFSMFYSLLIPLIISQGLDPYFGFFHEKRGRHAALSSDLMELARPELVFFAADILNKGYFEKSDFKTFKDGVYLKPKATKVLCKLFMEKINFSNIMFPIRYFIKEEILK